MVSGIQDSLSYIPDSKVQDSGFHEPKFPGFRIRIPLHETKNKIKYRSAVLSCSVLKSTVTYDWKF